MTDCIGLAIVTLTFDAGGRVVSLGHWEGETERARSCAAHALVSARLSPPPGTEIVRTFDLTDRQGGLGVSAGTSTSANASTGADSRSTVSPSDATNATNARDPAREPSAAQATDAPELRAALDAQTVDILACTSTARALVRVDWSNHQIMSVALSNELAGSAVEGCVRSLLQTSLPTPATAEGTLLHLVRAPD